MNCQFLSDVEEELVQDRRDRLPVGTRSRSVVDFSLS